MPAGVLVASDDPEMARIWSFALRQRQLDPVEVTSAAQALRCVAGQLFDLVIIDTCQGGLDPIDLARRLRGVGSTPILLLTPEDDEACQLRAYAAGVDECIIKPIGPLLFLAKVQSWLNRSWHVRPEPLASVQAGGMQLNAETRELVVDGDGHHRLTNLEYRLLHSLMTHPGQLLPTDLLIERLWGSDGGDPAMLKNVIYRLRRKIEPPESRQHIISSVPGQGYRFNRR